MSEYRDLVLDVRGMSQIGQGVIGDRTVLRQVWASLVEVVNRVVKVSPQWPTLPRSKGSAAVAEGDFLTGIAIPGLSANVARVLTVEARYSDDRRRPVQVINPNVRWDKVQPLPAAFIADGRVYPIPADGRELWTTETIRNARWGDVATVHAEWVALPPEPDDESIVVPVSVDFEQPAVLRSVWVLTGDQARGVAFDSELQELIGRAGLGPAEVTEVVQQVR